MLDAPETYIQVKDQGAFGLASIAKLQVGVADMTNRAPEGLTLQSTLQGYHPGPVIALLRDEDFFGPNGKVICRLSRRGPFRLKALFDNYYRLLNDGSLNWEQVSEY